MPVCTDRPGLLLCHPWEGQNIILASLYFLVFPCGPITTAPSLSTGHSHSICLFYGSFSQEIQEARGNQNEVRVTSFGVRSKGASLSWVETVRFLALLSFLGSPGFHSSGHCLLPFATCMLLWLRCLSSNRDGYGHVMFSGCLYYHVMRSIYNISDKEVISDLYDELF